MKKPAAKPKEKKVKEYITPKEEWKEMNLKVTTLTYVPGNKQFEVVGVVTHSSKGPNYVRQSTKLRFDPEKPTDNEFVWEFIKWNEVDADWIIDYKETYDPEDKLRWTGTLVKIKD